MRNLKKLLAVIMVVAMLASIMVPALAADNETVAKQLQDLGLFRGYSDTELGLGDYLTREQALTFMLRVMGLEDEALAMSKEEVAEYMALVVDPETVTPTWAQPYVAYGIKTGLVKGIDASIAPKVKFDGQRVISGQEFVRFIMNGLGYTEDVVSWNEVMGKAVEVGLLSANEAIALVQMSALTRGAVVPVLASALTATTIEGITLAERLIESGDVDEDKLIEYGFFTPSPTPTEVPVEFAVEEVYALNLKQIAIVFTKPVDKDSAKYANNYSLDGTYELQDDGVTVIGTLNAPAENQSSKELTIKDVKDTDGNLIKKTTVTVDFLDMEIPEAVSAEVVGKDTIKVRFSEPLEVDDLGETSSELRKGFSLKDANGKNVYVNRVKFSENNTVANVTFYSKFNEGLYTLTVNNSYKDYAGYTVVKRTFELEVVVDEEAPVVVDYKDAKPYEVTLIFNEDIVINKNNSATDVYFYHTNYKNPAKTVKAEGNELTLEFDPEAKMPAGTVYVYIAKEAIKDLWDNKNPQQIMVPVEVVGDEEAPYVVEVEATAQNKIKVTFNEEIKDEGSAKLRGYFKLLDNKGNEIKSIIRTAEADKKVVTLTLREDISGTYTLVVEGVKDKYDNEMDKQTVEFTVEDKTAPEYKNFTATLHGGEQQTLIIDFKDVMATDGIYSVLDLEKYQAQMYKYNNTTKEWESKLVNVELADIEDGIDIAISEDGKKVEITLDTKEAGYKFVAGENLKIARVADAAGNRTAELSGTVKIEAATFIGADKFEATSKDTLTLTLKGTLADFAEEDFILSAYDGENEVKGFDFGDVAIEEELNSSGKSVIIFRLLNKKLNANGKIAAEEYTIKVSSKLNPTSKDAYGAEIKIKDVELKDTIKPSLEKVNGKYITIEPNKENELVLTFDEVVWADKIELAALDFVVEADGEVLDPGFDYEINMATSANNAAKEVRIILKNDFRYFDGTVTVSTADTLRYIKDKAGNLLAEIDGKEVEVNIPPTVTEVVYNAGQPSMIVVKFSEEMDVATLVVDNFEVFNEKNEKITISNIAVNSDANQVTITINGTLAVGYKITIKDKITDYAGNNLNAEVTKIFNGSSWVDPQVSGGN